MKAVYTVIRPHDILIYMQQGTAGYFGFYLMIILFICSLCTLAILLEIELALYCFYS